MPPKKTSKTKQEVVAYEYKDSTAAMRPDIGTQAHFRKKKPPKTYRYDSSLAPELQCDGKNVTREEGEALIAQIEKAETLEDAKVAASKLKAMSKPFLNWAGKAERPSFDVPTLPLFVHERLSTKAILESLKGRSQSWQANLFADPHHTVTDQVLKAYEHRDQWVNRLILGDSLVVMNSLLHYESLGGQVQMIYIDPPYGVKFGSNFQPFVRKRDVGNNDDEDMTREPEMVQAYRDTWELGLHSYLSYLRDRLYLAHDLLASTGSVFVQISDENLHHVREVMDEVFGAENFLSIISFRTTGGFATNAISRVGDFLLWYARDVSLLKYKQVFEKKENLALGDDAYKYIELPDGSRRPMTNDERNGDTPIPKGSRIFRLGDIQSQGSASDDCPFEFEGHIFRPNNGSHWKAKYPDGMQKLAETRRIMRGGNSISYVRFLDDNPVEPIKNVWLDTGISGFSSDKIYAVQTNPKVIQRCMLMTTDPGDLVIDPTCGSGTTAYVAEQWGRRWITIDTSRVPLALTRQRLLTSTFDWYELKDADRGPGGGFIYKRRQNRKGEEVGGIVPHVTLKSIANNEPSEEEVLVDKPEITNDVVRVTGPFTVEATIPTPVDWEGDGIEDSGTEDMDERTKFTDRMIEVLRRSPVIRVSGNKSATFKNVRPIARSLALAAEAMQENGQEKPVAFAFGPENGAVSESLVFEAVKEANARGYKHLFVIGFAIQPNAQESISKSADAFGIGATYVPATMDLVMSDLLKTTRSSQVFSVCGKPEIAVSSKKGAEGIRYQAELKGLDLFDPITMETDPRPGDDVPMWMLDTDYNGLSFRACQVFFPRTSAWDALKRTLKAEFDPGTFEHLAGTISAPFEAGENKRIAVKVIDDRGNELLAVQDLPKTA